MQSRQAQTMPRVSGSGRGTCRGRDSRPSPRKEYSFEFESFVAFGIDRCCLFSFFLADTAASQTSQLIAISHPIVVSQSNKKKKTKKTVSNQTFPFYFLLFPLTKQLYMIVSYTTYKKTFVSNKKPFSLSKYLQYISLIM